MTMPPDCPDNPNNLTPEQLARGVTRWVISYNPLDPRPPKCFVCGAELGFVGVNENATNVYIHPAVPREETPQSGS